LNIGSREHWLALARGASFFTKKSARSGRCTSNLVISRG
jgi:hypothetical protein